MQQPEPAQESVLPPEPQPISPGELLMRRVPAQPKYYKNGKIQQGVFRPRKYPNDKEGLSLSRQRTNERQDFLTAAEFKANCSDQKMKMTAGVLIVPVDVIREEVGPQVKPDPTKADEEKGLVADPGHVVVPEINSKLDDGGPDCTDESKKKLREIAAALAHQFSDDKHFAIIPG